MQIISGLKKSVTNNQGQNFEYWVIGNSTREFNLNEVTDYYRNQIFKNQILCYKDQVTFENTEFVAQPEMSLSQIFRVEFTAQEIATLTFIEAYNLAYIRLKENSTFFADSEIIYKEI